ncbi:TlyA family RNA methyltransferase [Phenylobacterium sp.]|jgi:23S rRNA (cytidine1920-2'-O)/16S rRNA (cytidine1409-2'-O)-methyltransferase|uniref:TlyA family RNA methyltransferase n=1 Tax=Phenylobacterium sp. TaxID=1871053 RepID=UPI004035B20E
MGRKRADLLLVERGLFDSRAKARAAIEAGRVLAGGTAVARPSDLLDDLSEITAEPAHPWVGRAALKLAHALELWPITVEGRSVLDVGASTGGFTEVCLHRGAARVCAVDVGRGQLHPKVAGDPRVHSLEATDARDLDAARLGFAPDLIVCDVSFISLTKALPMALALAAPGADLVVLVKPQFEVGPALVGKGGVVKDEAARTRALDDAKAFLTSSGWAVNHSAPSPITGGDGNVEHLVWATKRV